VSTARTVTPRIKCTFVIFLVSATFFSIFIELHAFYLVSVALDKRNFEMLRNLIKVKCNETFKMVPVVSRF
jgi:hypothetical protein